MQNISNIQAQNNIQPPNYGIWSKAKNHKRKKTNVNAENNKQKEAENKTLETTPMSELTIKCSKMNKNQKQNVLSLNESCKIENKFDKYLVILTLNEPDIKMFS